MALIVKDWRNLPSTLTPLSAEALEDLEQRLGDYADSAGGGIDPATFTAKAQMLSSSGSAAPVVAGGEALGDGDVLYGDTAHGSGMRRSPKGADYNLLHGGTIVTGAGASAGQAATNTTAINAALTAAASQGRRLFFPPVTIMHTAGIQIPSNTHWVGCGKGRSILRTHASVGMSTPGGIEIITNTRSESGNNSNITLESFEIDGNRAARGATNFYVVDGTWSGGQLTFHSTTASSNIRLLNLVQHHAVGVGINMSGVDGLLVQGCEIYSNGRDGCSVILITGRIGKNIRYIGNRIYGCGDDCIGLFGYDANSIQNVTIAGNVLGFHAAYTSGQYGGHAVAGGSMSDVEIVGNAMPSCAIGGIAIFNGYQGGTADSARVVINGNSIILPGFAKLPTVEDSGHGIELICQSGSGNVKDISIVGNQIQSPMGDGIVMDRRAGTGTINNIRVANNTIAGGFGANYFASGSGISVRGAGADYVQVNNNQIRDTRGRGIRGNNLVCSHWQILNNAVLSGGKGGAAGAGGAHIDITNFVDPVVAGNTVRDFASQMQYALAWGGASGLKLHNNNFTSAGANNTVGTVGSGMIQWNNVGRNGTLYAGSTPTAGVMPV